MDKKKIKLCIWSLYYTDNKDLVLLLYFAQNQSLYYTKCLQLVPPSKFVAILGYNLDEWTNYKHFI